jgi:hypothetical protein
MTWPTTPRQRHKYWHASPPNPVPPPAYHCQWPACRCRRGEGAGYRELRHVSRPSPDQPHLCCALFALGFLTPLRCRTKPLHAPLTPRHDPANAVFIGAARFAPDRWKPSGAVRCGPLCGLLRLLFLAHPPSSCRRSAPGSVHPPRRNGAAEPAPLLHPSLHQKVALFCPFAPRRVKKCRLCGLFDLWYDTITETTF